MGKSSLPFTTYYHGTRKIKSHKWFKTYCIKTDLPKDRFIRKLHRDGEPAIIRYDQEGRITNKEWCVNGELHCPKEPAFIEYFANGKEKTEKWFIGGTLHREDGPAVIEYFEEGGVSTEHTYKIGELLKSYDYYVDGSLLAEKWYKDENLHREDGPAVIEYFEEGGVSTEKWFIEGVEHREDGPAEIEYFIDGKIQSECWYKDGCAYREDGGPTTIEYDEITGRPSIKEWGNPDGPPEGPFRIVFKEDGCVDYEEWWVNGELCRK